eukprot:scaffold6296_cov124-Isochrysis_galbana.AAC.3
MVSASQRGVNGAAASRTVPRFRQACWHVPHVQVGGWQEASECASKKKYGGVARTVGTVAGTRPGALWTRAVATQVMAGVGY